MSVITAADSYNSNSSFKMQYIQPLFDAFTFKLHLANVIRAFPSNRICAPTPLQGINHFDLDWTSAQAALQEIQPDIILAELNQSDV